MYKINDLKFKNILNIKELKIDCKKTTCIIGESGSGKSTLLRLLTKLDSPDSGTILYNDKNISLLDSIKLRRNTVLVPQNPVIYPGTIKYNLLIGIIFSEKTIPNDDVLIHMLEFLNLKKELSDDCEKLSGGEKQRISIGRVLLMDPHVFLLDEPSSALDKKTEDELIKKLSDYIKKKNKTLIMVTHSPFIAQTYGDEIITIEKKR